mmetsp:Transcript_12597/g.17965  ORF Transcript_12597/g.17965 Transcript_12597/m.17965 type:complete len:240 (-) Transcript_12597:111-830(-)
MKIVRRISILRGKVITDDTNKDTSNHLEQRHIIIIPPHTGTLGNTHAIHCIALDHSVNVAVAPYNVKNNTNQDNHDSSYTVLHLTTTFSHHDNRDAKEMELVLQRTVQALTSSSSSLPMQGYAHEKEVYQITFRFDDTSVHNYTHSDRHQTVDNLYICNPAGQSLTIDAAFLAAKKIFHKILSDDDGDNNNNNKANHVFLQLSKEMDTQLKSRNIGRHAEEDDEYMMLESAMTMLHNDS